MNSAAKSILLTILCTLLIGSGIVFASPAPTSETPTSETPTSETPTSTAPYTPTAETPTTTHSYAALSHLQYARFDAPQLRPHRVSKTTTTTPTPTAPAHHYQLGAPHPRQQTNTPSTTAKQAIIAPRRSQQFREKHIYAAAADTASNNSPAAPAAALALGFLAIGLVKQTRRQPDNQRPSTPTMPPQPRVTNKQAHSTNKQRASTGNTTSPSREKYTYDIPAPTINKAHAHSPNSAPTNQYSAPAVRLWPSRDPIGEKGGVNLYGFVNNDSLFGFDLLGYKKGIPFDLRGFAQDLAVAAAVQVLADFSVKLDLMLDHLPMACTQRMLDSKDLHADYPFSISKGTPAVSSYRDFGAKVLEIFVDGFLGELGKKYIKGDGLPIGVDPQGKIAEKILDTGIEALPGKLREALKNAVLETTGGELIIKNASDNCSVNARFSILMKIKVPGLDEISFRQEVMSGDIPNTITAIQQKCQLKPAVIKKNK